MLQFHYHDSLRSASDELVVMEYKQKRTQTFMTQPGFEPGARDQDANPPTNESVIAPSNSKYILIL